MLVMPLGTSCLLLQKGITCQTARGGSPEGELSCDCCHIIPPEGEGLWWPVASTYSQNRESPSPPTRRWSVLTHEPTPQGESETNEPTERDRQTLEGAGHHVSVGGCRHVVVAILHDRSRLAGGGRCGCRCRGVGRCRRARAGCRSCLGGGGGGRRRDGRRGGGTRLSDIRQREAGGAVVDVSVLSCCRHLRLAVLPHAHRVGDALGCSQNNGVVVRATDLGLRGCHGSDVDRLRRAGLNDLLENHPSGAHDGYIHRVARGRSEGRTLRAGLDHRYTAHGRRERGRENPVLKDGLGGREGIGQGDGHRDLAVRDTARGCRHALGGRNSRDDGRRRGDGGSAGGADTDEGPREREDGCGCCRGVADGHEMSPFCL